MQILQATVTGAPNRDFLQTITASPDIVATAAAEPTSTNTTPPSPTQLAAEPTPTNTTPPSHSQVAAEPTPITSDPTAALTQAQVSDVLDISVLLPESFERLSTDNVETPPAPGVGAVVVYQSEDPLQLVVVSLELVLDPELQRAHDLNLANESGLHAELLADMPKSPADLPPGPATRDLVELPDPIVNISSPKIGEKALSGTSSITVGSLKVGADVLRFKRDSVYIAVFSQYMGQLPLGVDEVASLIDRRLMALAR